MEINSCRICFTAEKLKLLSLFTVKIDDETLAEMVISLSGIEIIQDDNLPSMICIECLSHVSSACETRRKCIEADKSLRSLQSIDGLSDDNNLDSLRDLGIVVEMVDPSADASIFVDPEDSVEISRESQTKNSPQTRQSNRRKNDEVDAGPKKLKIKKSSDKIFCETCGEGFESNLDLCSHSESKHVKDSKEFFCDLCAFSSKRKKNVERHILAVHMKCFKFICPANDCKRQYTTQASLRLHCVRDHDEISPFKCEKCKQKFSCESLLKIHRQRLTCRPRRNKGAGRKQIEKTLACPHCDFRTAHQFSLTQHVNLIHLNIRKSWKCSHCENTEFSNRISLSQHMFSFHNLSHIRCPDCDQAFTSESQLQAHKKDLKCNARKATESDYEESGSGVKCTLCNRSYKTKKEWITHYFNHHKFNKICDVCGVQLSTYASLKNHKKTIHEKIKAFQCTECPKKFSAKHTLEFHLNTHSGIKPYGCKFCSFKASDRSSISKHQKKLHPGMS